MGTEPTESRESAEKLLKDYVAVVNRVLEENRGKFPYEHALRAARTFWGERPIRTLVYGRDPQDLLGVFFLRLEPDTNASGSPGRPPCAISGTLRPTARIGTRSIP